MVRWREEEQRKRVKENRAACLTPRGCTKELIIIFSWINRLLIPKLVACQTFVLRTCLGWDDARYFLSVIRSERIVYINYFRNHFWYVTYHIQTERGNNLISILQTRIYDKTYTRVHRLCGNQNPNEKISKFSLICNSFVCTLTLSLMTPSLLLLSFTTVLLFYKNRT